jgi:hypothetical protein
VILVLEVQQVLQVLQVLHQQFLDQQVLKATLDLQELAQQSLALRDLQVQL